MTSKKERKGEILVKGQMIVDFLALDPTAFEFGEVKLNKYKSRVINIRYRGHPLLVKFPSRTLPFGVNVKTPLTESNSKDVSIKEENATGYDVAWSLGNEYNVEGSEDNLFYKKAQELDQMFMENAVLHRTEWLQMFDEDEKSAMKRIKGFDEYGGKGIWKRVLKWSRNKADPKTGRQEVNLKYAPRINSSFIVKFDEKNQRNPENNRKLCTFNTHFFDKDGVKINFDESDKSKTVNESNYDEICPKYSKISKLANWSHLTASDSWLTLKSDIKQCRITPPERLSLDENYLDDDEADELDDLDTNYLEEPKTKTEKAMESFEEHEEEHEVVEEEIKISKLKKK